MLHGKKHWLYHRFTAILLLPLIIWFIYSLSRVPEITYSNMILWTSKTPNYIFLFVLILISARHFQLGIQVILEDYISNKKNTRFLFKTHKYHILFIIIFRSGFDNKNIFWSKYLDE